MWCGGRFLTFSPLFIGEGSSTIFGACDSIFNKDNFQSPLHRGRLFNHRRVPAVAIKHINFQSPLHRGRLFNPLEIFLIFNKLKGTIKAILRNNPICTNNRPVCENSVIGHQKTSPQ